MQGIRYQSFLVTAADLLPVYQRKPVGDIIRPPVLVLEVVGVFPQIQVKQRVQIYCQGRILDRKSVV